MIHHSTSYFVVFCIIAAMAMILGCNCNSTNPKTTKANQNNMNDLIERLADVGRKPITIGGEAVIYQPKEDKTVRQEILDKGFSAVPALINGLKHKREDVRRHCASLLSKLPRRSGVNALVNCISQDGEAGLFLGLVHISLHSLTGESKYAPPGGVHKPDVRKIKEIWLPWWEENKDRIVDTDTGIGLKNDDGTITPLPLKKK